MSKGDHNLDLGICPARFQIKQYKLNFLHYILNQEEESLLLKFFQAQLDNPTKRDWVSQVKVWTIEYDIGKSFQEVKYIKKSLYEKIIYEKIHEETFYYLKGKIKSKGSQIDYGFQLIMQDYLKPNNVLTFREQLKFFHTDLK